MTELSHINLAWWNKIKKNNSSKYLPTLGLTPALKKHEAAWDAREKKPSIPNCDAAAKALKALDQVRKDSLTTLKKIKEKDKAADADKALSTIYSVLNAQLDTAIKRDLKIIADQTEALGLESEMSRTVNKGEAVYLKLLDEVVKVRKTLEEARSPEGFEKAHKLIKECQRSVLDILENADPKLKISYQGRLQILLQMEKDNLKKQEELKSYANEYVEMHKKVRPVLTNLLEWTTQQAKLLVPMASRNTPFSEEEKNELWKAFVKFHHGYLKQADVWAPGTKIRNFRFDKVSSDYRLTMGKIFQETNLISSNAAKIHLKLVSLFEQATGKSATSDV